MVNFQTMFLLKVTILRLHEAQAPNGQFSNNVLIKNDHSEPPRGAGSEWSILINVRIENDNSGLPRGAGSE